MKNLILFVFFLSLLVAPAQAPTLTKIIDSISQKAMVSYPTAGFAIGVVKDNKIVYEKGFGIASKNTWRKADKNTLFAIASNSKAFTAVALAKLAADNKLKWTDKVIQFIPEFKMYNDYVTEHFTITDLLTHRSGLGLGAGDLMFYPPGADFTIEDVVQCFQYFEPVSEFRTQYDYDNLLYMVAGEVIYRITGKTWVDFVEKEIMGPLGMEHSVATLPNVRGNKNIAQPHVLSETGIGQIPPLIRKGRSLEASGGIYSSVSDLNKWLLLHLNRGKYGRNLEKTLIPEAAYDQLWSIQTPIAFNAMGSAENNNHYKGYGLGFRLLDVHGYTLIEHSGGRPGMKSLTTIIPELHVGIIVLTNDDGVNFRIIRNAIKDYFISDKPKDWITWGKNELQKRAATSNSTVQKLWATIENNKTVKIDAEKYIGVYKDPWFGEIEVHKNNGQLWFTSKRSPKLNGPMFWYKSDTFAIQWEYRDMECDAFAHFTGDKNGKSTHIKMEGISPDMDFSFDFQDLNLIRQNPD